jgi:hypothetical protein
MIALKIQGHYSITSEKDHWILTYIHFLFFSTSNFFQKRKRVRFSETFSIFHVPPNITSNKFLSQINARNRSSVMEDSYFSDL